MNITEWSLRKRLMVGVPAVMAVIALVAFGIVSLIGSFGTPGAPVPMQSHETSSAYRLIEASKADDERAGVQQWVSDKLPAYVCNGKTKAADFTKYAELQFCPDYTVIIEPKGRKATDVPVITNTTNGMIKVKPIHYGNWENNSDTLGKDIWVEGWYFEVTYDPSVIPAGINEQYNYTYPNNGKLTSWTGPLGYDLAIGQVNSSGALVTHESFSDSTVYVEIYAASRDLAVAGAPIAVEKDPRRS